MLPRANVSIIKHKVAGKKSLVDKDLNCLLKFVHCCKYKTTTNSINKYQYSEYKLNS